ncbi:acyl-CoA N-acyltransferase [Microdochium bolleyi]|uniref:Acyl-CoA N-acyltransferase n=1 Tax=Microdochium bolleyi TaxID=196109 RepID=A0A136J497_9PEZI|nr:acyl-CoA N-acyltransferase [Microdochium bolleyi]
MADSTPPPQQQPAWLTGPSPAPIISTPNFHIRAYTLRDAPALAAAGDSPEIAHRVGDRFPSPYRVADAEFFITKFGRPDPENGVRDHSFGIFRYAKTSTGGGGGDGGGDGQEQGEEQVIGGIGLIPQAAEARHTCDIGYWLAKPVWGKGLATEVVREFVSWAFAAHGLDQLVRIQARHHGGNERSGRVLEKNGFVREGVLRKAWACRDDGDVTRAAEAAAAAASAATKDGTEQQQQATTPPKQYVLDLVIYGLLREDFEELERSRKATVAPA